MRKEKEKKTAPLVLVRLPGPQRWGYVGDAEPEPVVLPKETPEAWARWQREWCTRELGRLKRRHLQRMKRRPEGNALSQALYRQNVEQLRYERMIVVAFLRERQALAGVR